MVLGHKDNPVHKPFPIMHTDGSGEEFLGRYPQIVKLWKQYFKSKHICDVYKFMSIINTIINSLAF